MVPPFDGNRDLQHHLLPWHLPRIRSFPSHIALVCRKKYIPTSLNSLPVFVRTKDFSLLAGVLLALTGCEAMFAKFVLFQIYWEASQLTPPFSSLGQFNATSIRVSRIHLTSPSCYFSSNYKLSFCTFVYPGIVLAYLGQGARLIHDGESVLPNVFYNTIPGPVNGALFWCVLDIPFCRVSF